MKFVKTIAVLFLNVVAVQSFSFPYKSFANVLSDEMIIHELTHKPKPIEKVRRTITDIENFAISDEENSTRTK